ncbi:MAG TPA: vitamin K epoxide reductase [Actinomycetota bacterium]|nr:vitamin K epoxide reductase [Actinomycetota bacterium]
MSASRVLTVATGLWLMASPAVLGYGGAAAISDRIVGPWLVTLAIVAMWESTRAVRLANLAFVPWLAVAPWVLSFPVRAAVVSLAVAGLIALTAFRTPMPRHLFGGGWRSLWASPQRDAHS